MTEADTARVWRIVWAIMGRWEADMPAGSAWQPFVNAWHEAVQSASRPSRPQRLALHHAWQAWLKAGRSVAALRAAADPPDTRESPDREPGARGLMLRPSAFARVDTGPFAPEQLLPAQWDAAAPRSGERALLLAILEDACHILTLEARGENSWLRVRREASAWMRSDDRSDVCAFLSICELAGFDAHAIRKRYGLA